MSCKVEAQVQGPLVSLDERASVQQAAELMTARKVGSLVVMHEGEVVGLFTEQDLLRRVVADGRTPADVRLGEVCTRDLISVASDTDCLRAIAKMQANRCRRLLVYRGRRFLGVVNLTDLAHALTRKGRGQDLVVNAFGVVTLVVAVAVIAILLLKLPEVMQLTGDLGSR
jgi:signal-transduction protein with cAMP-binding, CBS, and nucleotidyltransferase domain